MLMIVVVALAGSGVAGAVASAMGLGILSTLLLIPLAGSLAGLAAGFLVAVSRSSDGEGERTREQVESLRAIAEQAKAQQPKKSARGQAA